MLNSHKLTHGDLVWLYGATKEVLEAVNDIGRKTRAELDGEGGGTIASELHEGLNDDDDLLALAALDAIESMVFACAVAGIDISTPAFLQSIETAIESINNQYG